MFLSRYDQNVFGFDEWFDPVNGFLNNRPVADNIQQMLWLLFPAARPEPCSSSPGHNDGVHADAPVLLLFVGAARPHYSRALKNVISRSVSDEKS